MENSSFWTKFCHAVCELHPHSHNLTGGNLGYKKEVKHMSLDWKPRHRDMIIGGIPWLARISDKANAKLQGIIGEYIYP